MSNEERPEGSGGAAGKAREDESSPPEPGRDPSVSSPDPRTSGPAASPPGSPPAGDSSAAYVPPAPGSASKAAGEERGISGALALWGPLIIIGFLVLVLNTDNAPQRPGAGDVPAVAAAESEAAAQSAAAAAALAAATAAVSAESAPPPAEESAPAAVPESAGTAADAPPAAPVAAEAVEVAALAPEPTPAAEEPVEADSESAEAAGDLNLGAVLEAARSVIGQGSEASTSETAAAAPPPAPEPRPAARPEAPPPLPPAAPSAPAAPLPWSVPPPSGYFATYPVWSSAAAHYWAAMSSVPGEAMRGPAAESEAAAGDANLPPPDAAQALPAFHPPPALFPGAGYWPRPPVLVPCAPPYYWCIALPVPLYAPPPPGTY